VKVKLKSNDTLPFLNIIPPNIYCAGAVVSGINSEGIYFEELSVLLNTHLSLVS
jgi:hypothetical protein